MSTCDLVVSRSQDNHKNDASFLSEFPRHDSMICSRIFAQIIRSCFVISHFKNDTTDFEDDATSADSEYCFGETHDFGHFPKPLLPFFLKKPSKTARALAPSWWWRREIASSAAHERRTSRSQHQEYKPHHNTNYFTLIYKQPLVFISFIPLPCLLFVFPLEGFRISRLLL